MRTGRPIQFTREAILTAALHLARAEGYNRVSRAAIAEAVGCSPANIALVLGTMPKVRRAIMSAAIAERDLTVLAQGLVAKEAKALAAPLELRQKAIASLL